MTENRWDPYRNDNPQMGDICTLASGGPQMTITDVTHIRDYEVRCYWFDTNLSLQQAWFPLKILRKVRSE